MSLLTHKFQSCKSAGHPNSSQVRGLALILHSSQVLGLENHFCLRVKQKSQYCSSLQHPDSSSSSRCKLAPSIDTSSRLDSPSGTPTGPIGSPVESPIIGVLHKGVWGNKCENNL